MLIFAFFYANTIYAQEIKQLESTIGNRTYTDQGAKIWYKGYERGFTKAEEKVLNNDFGGWVDPGYQDYFDVLDCGCSWYCYGEASVSGSSSHLKSQGQFSYNQNKVSDFSVRTAWIEGVEGDGIGEWVEFTVGRATPITEVYIVNGYAKSQKAFQNNSRVKQLKIYENGKPYAILNLKDCRSIQVFKLGTSKGLCGKIRFEIMDVYKGDLYEDTAISEIFFSGLGEHG